ncbi:MAG: glycosyltransferase [Clostridia bacterium]|nr:glycosyltransferase [Clostridia bacterium]
MNEHNSKKISIIIPVYKVEKYLQRCLDSVISQTYKNLEIILVDDGSPDNCGRICDEYAEKDDRIRVIHQENGGLSAARNAGLDIAIGDYIGFVDSDDYVARDMYEKLYNVLIENDADEAICNYEFIDEFENELKYYSPIKDEVLSGAEAIIKLNYEYHWYYLVAWNKLYKKSVFEGERFPVGKVCEDNFIVHKLFYKCRKIVTLSEKLYFYTQRKDSIMGDIKLSIKRADEVQGYIERYFFEKKHGIEKTELAARKAIDFYKFFRKEFIPVSKKEKERIKELDSFAKRLYNESSSICSSREHIIFHLLTLYPYIAKTKNKFLLILDDIMVFMNSRGKSVVFNTPTHGNLGDQAIVVAEKQLLNKHSCFYEVSAEHMNRNPTAAKLASKGKKVVFVHGGGNIGYLWPEEEKRIRKIIQINQKRKVVVFPQTVTFDTSHTCGIDFLNKLKETYCSHPDLTIFTREQISFDFLQKNMPQIKSILVPDVVLGMNVPLFNCVRNKILFCIREDREKSFEDLGAIKKIVLEKYPDIQVEYSDNVVYRIIEPENREEEVYNRLKSFAEAKLVITDRLHGMIFAAITATPCIAFDNSNGKVSGVYDAWLKNLDYIIFCNNISCAEKALDYIDISTRYTFDSGILKNGINTLEEVIYKKR